MKIKYCRPFSAEIIKTVYIHSLQTLANDMSFGITSYLFACHYHLVWIIPLFLCVQLELLSNIILVKTVPILGSCCFSTY